MADNYLSEIRIFAFGFAPKGWAQCNGQLLPINQNQALFALLGTMYGGNGIQTFGLPNLAGRTMMGVSPSFIQGQLAGEPTHTLTINELPIHNHFAVGSSNSPTANTPANNFWPSNTGHQPYASTSDQTMATAAIGVTGGSQAHQNMSPFLTLNICIALTGIFPSRN